MAMAACTEDEFIALWKEKGSPAALAQHLGVAVRNVLARRRAIEARRGITLEVAGRMESARVHPDCEQVFYDHPYSVVFFADAHIWPEFTPAFYVLCEFLEYVEPDVVVDLGDFFDGARVSRHPKAARQPTPTLREELDACIEASGLIVDASREAEHLRIPGNHGERMANYIAVNASEFDGLPGTAIEDYFSAWRWAHSFLFNDTLFAIHTYKGGHHAGHNNALWTGRSTISGHDHRLACYNLDDLNGRRYGIHAGTLADIYGPQFAYMGHRPRQWASGFVYMEIVGSRIYPELIHVEEDGSARWRGKVLRG